MVTGRCRKATQSNSRLCRDRRGHKHRTFKKQGESGLHLFGRKGAPPFRPFLFLWWTAAAIAKTAGAAKDREGIPFYNRRMDNKQIARILRETAQLLEIDGAIIGRYRSYEKAAELIDSLPESIEQLVKEPEKLEELPGIGERMVEHLQEIVKTGDYSLRKKLLKKYPATILDLLQLQSLGPKKVAFLWSNFKAGTVADVEKLAKEGKLRDLPGFGEKSEQNILKAVEVFKKSSGRFHIHRSEERRVGKECRYQR